jgi:hypothetical protein
MKSVPFLCICIALVIVGFCSTVTADIGVGVVDIKPAGDLESGITEVVADFTIDFYPVGGVTMASNENIRLTTDLMNPSWGITLILEGVESKRFATPVRSGDLSAVDLSGWEFSYKTNDQRVHVQLTGKAPQVSGSKEILVAGVDLIDPSGRALNEAKRAMKFVLNPNELQGEVSDVSSKLSSLQSEIDRAAAKGIDVRAADAKYDEANASIASAKSATYADAQIYLQNAETFINEAQSLLNKATAESEMVEVQATIDAVDEWITYFQDNEYPDSRLAPIVTKREFASEDFVDAKAAFDKQDYSTAREKTQSAQTRASDALDEAKDLFAEVDSGSVAVTETQKPDGNGNTTSPEEADGSLIGKVLVPVVVIVILVIAAVLAYLHFGGGGSGGSGKRGGGGLRKGRSSKSSKHQYDELF